MTERDVAVLAPSAPDATLDLDDPGLAWAPTAPPGWEPVAHVCRVVLEGVEGLTEQTVQAIMGEVPGYAQLGPVPRADLRTSVRRNLEMMLRGVAEHRGPREEELAIRRQLGKRRAVQGLPLQSLIGAYHVGYRELWDALVREARHAGGEAPSLLLTGGATVWGWIHAVTSGVAEEYQKEVARREAIETRAHARFFALLRETPTSQDCVAVARTLRFDPSGRFQAIAFPAADGEMSERLRRLLDAAGVIAAIGEQDGADVFLCQGDVAACLPRLEGALGIGQEREGLERAPLSIDEALQALPFAVRRGYVCNFEDVWLLAAIRSRRDSLTPILGHAAEVAEKRPHLLEAVKAFSTSRFSVAEGARRLGLSQTSFRYRLERWRLLTDCDPWSWEGLARSLAVAEVTTSKF